MINLADGFSIQTADKLATTATLGRVLEPLAVRIFGHEGTRQPEWLGRKCRREGVDPGLSLVLHGTLGPVGYFLLGRRPSQPRSGFTAGLGVLPEVRRKGLGTALVRAGIKIAATSGLDNLILPAPTTRLAWYRKHGFQEIRCTHTWLSFAHGTAPAEPDTHAPWGLAGKREVCAWAPDIWMRMSGDQRLRYDLVNQRGHRLGSALCSPEGRALLCHRLVAAATGPIQEVLEGLLAGIARGTPVLLHEVDQVSSFTDILDAAGWDPVQTIHTLRRDLGTR